MVAILLAGCAGADLDGPDTGRLQISVTTVGEAPEGDGYSVSLDGGESQSIGPAGSRLLSGVPAGTHRLALGGLASNCSAGVLERTATVSPDAVARLGFDVACTATSSLQVTLSTSVVAWPGFNGSFAVVVDQKGPRRISANGTVTIDPIAPGVHTLLLKCPAGCIVGGLIGPHTNPVTVRVPVEGTATVRFAVLCIG